MAKVFAAALLALTALAAVADIASFLIANGGFITRGMVEIAAKARPAAPAGVPASCRKTTVISLDPECRLVSDPERRAVCLRHPPPHVEICVQTVQSR
jgi:hypothetical protein